jgi:hypothetical protein
VNIISYLSLSQMRKFDVHDSQKMPISQKVAMIGPVRPCPHARTACFWPIKWDLDEAGPVQCPLWL